MTTKNQYKIKYLCYSVLALICAALLVGSWLFRPSKNHLSQSCLKTEIKKSLADLEVQTSIKLPEQTVEIASDLEKPFNRIITCSDLNAQWVTSDIAFLSYFAGLVGIILLGVTLWETLAAGRALSEQNKIALLTSELELEPKFSVGRLIISNISEGIRVQESGKCTFHCVASIINNGQIAANITKHTYVFTFAIDVHNFATTTNMPRDLESYSVSGDGERIIYLPPHVQGAEKGSIAILDHFTVDTEKHPVGSIISEESIFLNVEIIVEYEDKISWALERSKFIKTMFAGRPFRIDSDGTRIDGTKCLGISSYQREIDTHPSKRETQRKANNLRTLLPWPPEQ